MANTVALKGPERTEEVIASGSIIPGMLVKPTTVALTFTVHDTAGTEAEKVFALEDESQGLGIDDAYATTSIMQIGYFQPGDEVNALLANGEVTTTASYLESNGDGYLRVVDADTSAGTIKVGSIVGRAMEAVDMTDSDLADPSGRVRVKLI